MKIRFWIFLIALPAMCHSQTFQWVNKFENCDLNWTKPDAQGNTYGAGWCRDSAVIANFPLFFPDTFYHLIIVKFDSSGSMLWVENNNYCTSNAYIFNVATDDSGNLVLSGYFEDSLYIGSSGYFAGSGTLNGLLIKYDGNGALLWMHRFNTNAVGLVVSPSQNIFLIFYSDSVVDLNDSTLLFQDTTSAHTRIWAAVVKFDESGNFLFSKELVKAFVFNGAFTNLPFDCLNVDYSENMVLSFYGNADFLVDTLMIVQPGDKQVIAKFDSSGNLSWHYLFSESSQAPPQNLYCDSGNNVYAAINFHDSITIGTYSFMRTMGNGSAIFKISPAGQVIWVEAPFADSTYGELRYVTGYGSNLYIAGGYDTLPCNLFGIPLNGLGFTDILIANLDTSGTLNWLKTAASPGYDYVWQSFPDRFGNTYLNGIAQTGCSFDTIQFTSAYLDVDYESKLGNDIFTFYPGEINLFNAELFPNPVSEKVKLRFNNVNEKMFGFLSDVNGKVLLNFEVAVPGKNILELDVAFLASGIYFIGVETDKGMLVKKFVKE